MGNHTFDLEEVSRALEGKYTTRKQDDRIGGGPSSCIIKGKSVMEGETVALKIVLKEKSHERREVFNQRANESPYILKLLNFVGTEKYMILVLEYCEGGNLRTFMRNNPLEYEDKVKIMWEIVEGMKAVWGSNIIHRDLKPENILLKINEDRSVTAKVADFGSSRVMEEGKEYTGGVGTEKYMAPEVEGGKYDSKADVWSLGRIFHKILNPKGSDPPTEFQGLLSRMTADSVEERFDTRSFVNEFTKLMYQFSGTDLSTNVYLYTHRPSKAAVAMKIKPSPGAIFKEFKTQSSLSHEYIASVRDYFNCGKTSTALVTEYYEGGNLRDFVARNGAIEELLASTWMKQLAQAVGHIHSKGFAHRHIQLDNVFLTEASFSGKLKLGDFSRAEWLCNLPCRDCSSIDLLGVGRVYYQLVTGSIVAEEGVPDVGLLADISCRDLITDLLTNNQRMNCKDLLSHPFIQNPLRRVASNLKNLAPAKPKYLQNAAEVIERVVDFASEREGSEWNAPAFALAKACCEQAAKFPCAGNERMQAAVNSISTFLHSYGDWEKIRTLSKEAYNNENLQDWTVPVKAMRLMWRSAQVMGISLPEALKDQQLYQSLISRTRSKNGSR